MSYTAISLDRLSKAYRIGLKDDLPETVLAAAGNWFSAPLKNLRRLRRLNTTRLTPPVDVSPVNGSRHSSGAGREPDDTIWALRDVSFEVSEGEVVGIIGSNGAGKSTLLKVLSRITEPTSGEARINGRVSSLLEVGTGFHPELTGRENVYMNGTLLGMAKREIDRKFDEIVTFSGVKRFLDTPIKRYSSGMQVRLAFAVAAHLEPDILIIDEVLAVGDAEFQRKCLGRMQDVATQGRSVLFVSHNMAAVRRLCSRAILLEDGRVKLEGTSPNVIAAYLKPLEVAGRDGFCAENPHRTVLDGPVLVGARIVDRRGHSSSEVIAGDAVTIEISYRATSAFHDVSLRLNVYDQFGTVAANLGTRLTGMRVMQVSGAGSFCCEIERLPLVPGRYRMAIAFVHSGSTIDRIPNGLWFDVVASLFHGSNNIPDNCNVMVPHQWYHRNGSTLTPDWGLAAHVPVLEQ